MAQRPLEREHYQRHSSCHITLGKPRAPKQHHFAFLITLFFEQQSLGMTPLFSFVQVDSMLVARDGQTPILFDTEAAWISPLISQVSLSIQQDTSGVLLGSCLLRGKHKLLQNSSKARPSRPVASLPLNSSVQSKARSTSASKKRRNRPRRQNKTKIDLCLPQSLCLYYCVLILYCCFHK